MKVKTIKTNDCVVVVEPRYAGNYGCIRIGGQSREPNEEYSLCENIMDDIKRHVDDVEHVYIKQQEKYLNDDETQEFDTLEDALISMFAPESYKGKYWKVHGKCSENEKYRTSTNAYSFNELVRCAYEYPYDFTISMGEITEDEKVIINKVIEYRKK